MVKVTRTTTYHPFILITAVVNLYVIKFGHLKAKIRKLAFKIITNFN